jgi:hypothetical protein
VQLVRHSHSCGNRLLPSQFLKTLAGVWLVTTDLPLTFSKVSEFIICDHLSYFSKHGFRPPQHGFRKPLSTSINSAAYVTYSFCSAATGGETDSVHFNLCNTVTFIKWLRSCLRNRQASVIIFDISPSSYTIKSGVLWGSNLGALLVNGFINDLCGSIYNSVCVLFVDLECTLLSGLLQNSTFCSVT